MSVKPSQILVLFALGLAILGSAGCTAEAKKARSMKRADDYFGGGAFERARIEYMNVLRRDPQNFKAASRIGSIYFERGQILAAFPFLAVARKLDSNNVDVACQLGLSYLAATETKKAREEAIFILEKNPTHEEAVLLLAETAVKPEEMEDTRRRLAELQQKVGDKAAFHLALNNLFLKQNDPDAAEKEVIKAVNVETNSAVALMAMGNLHWAKGEIEEADRYFASAAALSSLRSTRQLRRVDFKIQTGAVEEAKKILKNIIQELPDHIPAMAYEAKIAFAEKKFDECARANQRILTFDGVNYDALLLQARAKLAEGKNAEALKDLERMKTLYPKSPELRYYIGVTHLANEEVDKAILNLTQATTVQTNYSPAALLLAELNLRKGDATSAVQLLSPLVQRQPRLIQAHLLLATAYRTQNRLDEVVTVYRRLTTLFPKEADPFFLMGLTFRQQGKVAEAREAFEKAHGIDPKHVQALYQLVDMDVGEKKYDIAWKRIEADLVVNPQSPDLQFLIAKLHMVEKDPLKAEAALVKALELDAAYQPAYSALAQLYVDSQKHEQALEKLHAGIAKNPKDVVSLMKVGMIYEQLKDYPKAAAAYEKLLAVNGRFTPALNNLAYIYTERLNQTDKAYQLARKAREVSPHDPFSADTLGWVLFKRGEYSWALKLIQECAAHNRTADHPEVLYHLGMAYYMTGAEDQAREALTKAVDSKTEFPGKEEAQARLAVLNTDASKSPSEVMAQLQAALAKSPNDFIALLRMGAIHEQLGENEKARSRYEQALQVNPKSVSAIMTLARLQAEKLQNESKALELAKNARNLAPDDPKVLEMLGPLAYQAHDFSWALTLLQKSNEEYPGRPVTLYYLGLCYFDQGKIAEAIKTVQSALKVDSGFAQAEAAQKFVVFAELCANPDKAVEAEATIAERLKSEPNDTPTLFAYGLVQEQKEKWLEAKQAYENILARNPQSILAAKRLGILSAGQLKDDRRAMELLSKVRETLPDDNEVARHLGMLAYRKADYQWSAQLLKQAANSQSKPDALLLYNLGLAQYRLKQKNESKATLRQALALNDKDQLAEEARRVLAELK